MEQGAKASYSLGVVVVIIFVIAILSTIHGSSKPKAQDCLYTVTVTQERTIEACIRVVK